MSSINSSPETNTTAQVGRKEKLSQLSKNYKSDQGIMAADHGRASILGLSFGGNRIHAPAGPCCIVLCGYMPSNQGHKERYLDEHMREWRRR